MSADIPEEVEVARKMVVVIAFDLPEDLDQSQALAHTVLQSVKPIFSDEENVKVFGAVHEVADDILKVINEAIG